MLRYIDLLLHWNATYNLTALRQPGEILTHHLADSLAVVRPLRAHLALRSAGKRVLDVGSGAGLPGLIIALMEPGLQITCVDAVGKKVAFIRQAAAELGLSNVKAVHARVEKLRGVPFDLIAARAFSTLTDLVALTRHLLAPSGVWMAMKGKPPQAEIEAVRSEVNVFHVEPLTVPGLDAQRCLVWMAAPE